MRAQQGKGFIMGSWREIMSDSMKGLSGEIADSPTSQRSSNILAEPRPQIAVLGSSNPQTDVSTIQWLFPFKFRFETKQESIVMTERGNASGLVLMIVDCNTSGENMPVHWKNATFALEELEITVAAKRCRGMAATVFVRDTIEISRGVFSTLVVIRLSGGGNLVMMSHAFLQSPRGRQAFAEFLTSRENIELMDRNRGNESILGENMLQELEDEFNHRASCRRSSYGTIGSNLEDDISVGGPTRNFPTLGLSLQRKHGFMQKDVPINARTPIPFETDLFVGKMSILMRPQHPEDDPYHYDQVFSRTKVWFVLQIQGKFKYNPSGTVYAGLELGNGMKAALIMQGLCSLILRHVHKKHPNCHHSFGDDKENAHIVVPAWTFFDRLVVTRKSSTPPLIDQPFIESQGSVTARRSSRSRGAWNTNDTYSFASYSECIDFPSWHLVNSSFAHNTDMHNFLGDSPIKLVMYEHRDTTIAPEKHLQACNQYLISLQIKHLGGVLEAGEALNKDEEKIETPETLPWGKARNAARYDEMYEEMHNSIDNDDDESVDHEGEDEDGVDDAMVDSEGELLPCKGLLEIVNEACPGWVEVISDEPGKYKKVYAFQVLKNTKVVFRTPSEFKSYLGIQDASLYAKSVSSPRISASEEARRILGYAYAQALLKNTSKARLLASHKSAIDSQFLQREDQPKESFATTKTVLKTGFLARALSERHWREEYVRLFDDHVAFFHPLKTKPSFRISCSSMIEVERFEDGEGAKFVGYYFLQVGTLGRTVYLMFASENERDSWGDVLTAAVDANKKGVDCLTLDGIDDPTDQFLHKSTMWDCQQRRVLNCRRFSFGVPSSDIDPTALVEKSLLLGSEAQESPRDETRLVSFLDAVAALKDVDVYALCEKERMAFFLNLFHVMVIHAYLLLGPPDSSFKYVSMFQMVSYQLSDDIFCFAELEHSIIRGAMSYPSQFSSKLILPKSQYGFALKSADFRINFALSCGELNQSDSVPIYTAQILDIQFEAAALVVLEKVSIEQQPRKAILTLPRILQWYADDFGSTVMELLQTIEKYVDERCRTIIKEHVDGDERKLTLKYLPVEFECKTLKLESNKTRAHDASFEE